MSRFSKNLEGSDHCILCSLITEKWLPPFGDKGVNVLYTLFDEQEISDILFHRRIDS